MICPALAWRKQGQPSRAQLFDAKGEAVATNDGAPGVQISSHFSNGGQHLAFDFGQHTYV